MRSVIIIIIISIIVVVAIAASLLLSFVIVFDDSDVEYCYRILTGSFIVLEKYETKYSPCVAIGNSYV